MNTLPSGGDLTLAGDFPAADEAEWRALVAKVLKGADFERRLVRETDDGIAIQPLYTASTTNPGVPGATPYIRGAAAVATWDIRQRHGHGDPALVNAQILEDLSQGVTSIQLCLEPASPASLMRMLNEVDLELAPIGLEAGADCATAGEEFLKLAAGRIDTPENLRADLNADPLGAAITGASLDLDTAIQAAIGLTAKAGADWPEVVSLVADGRPYHAGGASEAQELACAVATGIAYLRALVESGLAPAAAAGRSASHSPSTPISSCRWRSCGRCVGSGAACSRSPGPRPPCPRCASTPRPPRGCHPRFDPYVNVLRGTVAAFAAAAGGATSITVLPFDHAIGSPQAGARRIARNTQHVLIEESSLGRVIDPAGGSWYVETLTEQLAPEAWALVQEIERQGGMLRGAAPGLPAGPGGGELGRSGAPRSPPAGLPSPASRSSSI